MIPLVTLIEDSLIQSRASLPAVLSPGITSLAAHEGEESRCTHSVAVSPLFPATASGREVGRPSLDSLPATFNPWNAPAWRAFA